MKIELTENDRKILKYEKRIGYVFMTLIYSFGGLFNLFYFIIQKDNPNYLMISLINLGIILLGFLACRLVNKDVNKDLKENNKTILVREIKKKYSEKSYETGSGNLYIPILGDIFPKLFGQKMREGTKYFIIAGEFTHEVEKNDFLNLKEGENALIHYGRNSGTVLRYEKEDQHDPNNNSQN